MIHDLSIVPIHPTSQNGLKYVFDIIIAIENFRHESKKVCFGSFMMRKTFDYDIDEISISDFAYRAFFGNNPALMWGGLDKSRPDSHPSCNPNTSVWFFLANDARPHTH